MKKLTELVAKEKEQYETYLLAKKYFNLFNASNPTESQELAKLISEYEKSHEIK